MTKLIMRARAHALQAEREYERALEKALAGGCIVGAVPGGFLDGVAAVFDMGGQLRHLEYSCGSQADDAEALGQDWRAVGVDILAAASAARE